MRKPRIVTAAGVALGLLYSTQGVADASGWEFEVAPYLWAMGVDGEFTAGSIDYDASADFADILDQTKYGAQVMLQANRGDWVNFAQIDYGVLESDDITGPLGRADVKAEISTLLATFTTGYRLSLGERHSIDLMVGLRIAGFEVDVDNSLLGSSTEQESVYDAIIMLRPQFVLGEHWYLMPSASVGAGDSDLTWELFPEIIYQPGDLRFRLGYRDLNYEFEQGDAEVDIKMPGLVLGVGFTF